MTLACSVRMCSVCACGLVSVTRLLLTTSTDADVLHAVPDEYYPTVEEISDDEDNASDAADPSGLGLGLEKETSIFLIQRLIKYTIPRVQLRRRLPSSLSNVLPCLDRRASRKDVCLQKLGIEFGKVHLLFPLPL